jgi:hypothetical protein
MIGVALLWACAAGIDDRPPVTAVSDRRSTSVSAGKHGGYLSDVLDTVVANASYADRIDVPRRRGRERAMSCDVFRPVELAVQRLVERRSSPRPSSWHSSTARADALAISRRGLRRACRSTSSTTAPGKTSATSAHRSVGGETAVTGSRFLAGPDLPRAGCHETRPLWACSVNSVQHTGSVHAAVVRCQDPPRFTSGAPGAVAHIFGGQHAPGRRATRDLHPPPQTRCGDATMT